MPSQLITRPFLQAALKTPFLKTQATAAFSAIAFVMAEGSTGAPRAGGAASSDAFTKRESASEELFIRQQEREKLIAVKDKIAAQKLNLDELDKFIDEITTDKKGAGNEKK